MNCDDCGNLIELYADGELDASQNRDVEEHLRSCAACAALHQSSLVLRRSVRAAKFSAPNDLRERIQTELRHSRPAATPVQRRTPGPWLLTGLAIAASFLVGFFVAQSLSHRSAEETLLAQLTDNHLHSLLATHLIDVASSDQHTVRPWFEGKLDFAPPVEDLTRQGFPLVGGRVEYISGRTVAALVYERRKHFINLFIWPSATGDEKVTASPSQRGYNILHWRSNGMNYWAISEIARDDLRKFAAAFAQASVPSS